MALPIFSSDMLSSVAYGPQELLLMLTAGGLAFLAFAPWVAAAVVVLMVIVVVSYRQLIRAYPSGGGDYEVASKNLGENAGLIVASALLIDYVLTVAVSIASGVDNLISAMPGLHAWRIEIAVAAVVALIAMNLRGVAESSRAFAAPTYFFIFSVFVMIIVGVAREVFGVLPQAESSQYSVAHQDLATAGIVLLVLRAFASGCSALTGVEAIANGVPAFRRPKVTNAQRTLVTMGAIAVTAFIGITFLALRTNVHYAANSCDLQGFVDCETTAQRSVIAQLAGAVFGGYNSVGFYAVQAATALVLFLAANTAFNGFPSLGSVLSRDRYAPKALQARGDRLVFSNGVIILGAAAAILEIVFRANVNLLIQMYIIGVFISFTLGQSGMVIHWTRKLRRGHAPGAAAAKIKRIRVLNFVGAITTGTVLIIVSITKFTHGAWVVFLVMPILWFFMRKINRYYAAVEKQIEPDATTVFGSTGDHAIVLVHKLQTPVLKALDYAIAAQHQSLEAVHVATDPSALPGLQRDWALHRIRLPLTVLASPYRDVSTPLIEHIRAHREEHGSEVVSVYIPQYVFGHWWEGFLHNRKARRIRHRLVLCPGVAVVLVPWLLDSSRALYTRPPRPMPGLERRGVAALPVVRDNARK
ncbi:APC family permease [Demequina sp.]|uniref:APC family permease n=1 Tax=Demequina sp. TaxID=2050685 RepID=UPI003D148CF1